MTRIVVELPAKRLREGVVYVDTPGSDRLPRQAQRKPGRIRQSAIGEWCWSMQVRRWPGTASRPENGMRTYLGDEPAQLAAARFIAI